MATREQIESLKIDENVFELVEDTELEFLVHFAAPFTGGDKCWVPKGTVFAPHGPMRGDALYMHLVEDDNDELLKKIVRTSLSEYSTPKASLTPRRRWNRSSLSIKYTCRRADWILATLMSSG